MTIKTIVICFATIILISSCKCNVYFSETDSKRINEKFFDIECELIENVIKSKNDNLDILIDYKNILNEKVIHESIIIYPIMNNIDTLKFTSKYSSVYSFDFNKQTEKKIDVSIKFNVDSSGIILKKELYFSKLKRITLCRYRPILH